ncbi:hypothetical protein D3C72_2064050 [compost metagenome]
MQFVVGFDIEDAVVGVFAHHAIELLPLALPLQVLRVGLLARLDLIGLGRGHVVRQVDVHPYQIKHEGSSDRVWGRGWVDIQPCLRR